MNFGSVGLRGDNGEDYQTRIEKASTLFRNVAETAFDHGVQLCIEPLSGYGNRFITTTTQGIALVQEVDHPGFGLHLDSAAMRGANERADISLPIADKTVGIASFDISASELKRPSIEGGTHTDFAEAMSAIDYQGSVSLEMKGPFSSDEIAEELAWVRNQYNI